MSNNDNLTSVLNQAIRNRLAELHTAMPAQVVSYEFSTQKAKVQPTIKRKYADGRSDKYPVINDVPVIFPRSGGASMTFPVKAGDTVLLIFTGRSIEQWLNNGGGNVTPSDNRMHNLNDAVAIPGLIPFTAGSYAKNNEDVLITYKGSEIEILSNTDIRMYAPNKIIADTDEFYCTGDIVAKNHLYDWDKRYGHLGNFRDLYNIHTHNENDNAPNDTEVTNHPWELI